MDLAKIRRMVNEVEELHKEISAGCLIGKFACSLDGRTVWPNLDHNAKTVVATIIIKSYVDRIFLKIDELEECGVTFDGFPPKSEMLHALIESYKMRDT